MSCCPDPPEISVGSTGDPLSGIADNQILRGETTECYMATANNPTGKHDDGTGNVPNKIDTPSIPLDAEGRVDVTFRLQVGSDRVPTSWVMKDTEAVPTLVYGGTPWAGVTWNAGTGRLVGQFQGTDLGKTFKITISALDATGEIDNRGYNFAPAVARTGESIQFIHPLPGAVVTSRFDPNRFHPVLKIVKPHKGADFALPGGKIGDVLAAADGEVIFASPPDQPGGAGNYIKIRHVNGSGEHLCTTCYFHLAKIYVTDKPPQKVMAGQKIGLEGNTGVGTGAHLHFECRLPNGTATDPVPLIRGTLQVARETNPDNTAKASSVETQTSAAVLTSENVKAKQNCNGFGPSYPNPETALGSPVPAPPPGITDPFELAWALTMQTEVIGWGSTPPTVQSTLSGDIDTPQHRRAVGYVNDPADPGGVTKFGIAQKFNKQVQVPEIDYSTARSIGYTNYWNGEKPAQFVGTHPRAAIAIFNFGFLTPGGISKCITDTNASALSDLAAVDALCDAMKMYFLKKVEEQPAKKERYRNGWMNRVETVRAYCKAVLL